MVSHKLATLVSITPTVTSGVAYVAGNQLGVPTKLANVMDTDRGSAFLESITVIDLSKQDADIDFLFFSQQPTSAGADHAAATISAADMSNCLGVASITNVSYSDLAGNSVGSKGDISLLLKSPLRSKDLWVVAVVHTTPTYTTTTAVTVLFGFTQN